MGRNFGKSERASARKALTSAVNGELGGRPVIVWPADEVAKLGPPPTDSPLKMQRWWGKAIALDCFLRLCGKGSDALSTMIRGHASAASRVLPGDMIFEAQLRLRADVAELAESSDSEEEAISVVNTRPINRDPSRS